MKKHLISLSIIFGILFFGLIESTDVFAFSVENVTEFIAQADPDSTQQAVASLDAPAEEGGHDSHSAPAWLVIPFIILLLMIATGPLFYEHFWHHNYPKIAVGFAIMVVLYYLFVLGNVHSPVHALAEYIQFIALLTSLYVASGGILIEIDKKATPMANVSLLLIGAVVSNLIGTTGASMLLIRPFIRLNKGNIQAYHVVFFILMVSNVGGSLTPIGDPPLFLGFLKGVPFFWTIEHNWPAWAFALTTLATIFYFVDRKFGRLPEDEYTEEITYTNKLSLIGVKNFGWLFIIICAVFLDPNVIEGVPAIVYDGQKFSYLRETIMLSVAFFSYKFGDQKALKGNEFNFEPIREVAFIFVGIFGTMMPALELVGNFAKSPEGAAIITPNTLYWGTGVLSAVLDNAPTYLNFLAAAMASEGANINSIAEVREFAANTMNDSDTTFQLLAIAIASVFFGAMTYIGNGPNFMVKSIAEQSGVKMPSFFGYLIRFTLPILLPILFLVWLLFIAFAG
ncbi:sodium:proton antiporter [Algoriphagus boritolerans]|uniref:Na+/H+ antiporter NhaD n=1 Tax=Algoriphagus boritolerans DSM 17298 = JCM 18970 TaxID=1120964 RepID=A0A1H5YEA8_9BACT|nr:sodium:proton antiporter [Algoriphagus boritolerans]SEG22092.1 Na+/H+ antiporter NhaD [Algoriphagus boritolerans DSM 17298 = JCM 18970]